MKPADREVAGRLGEAARHVDGLQLLLVYGSRARGDCHATSDWDLGFIASPTFDADAFQALAVEILDSDRVDVADLDRASGLLRYPSRFGSGSRWFRARPTIPPTSMASPVWWHQ